jgi:phosphoglycerol transferase MdoB-like AlkP superfamily enzyme
MSAKNTIYPMRSTLPAAVKHPFHCAGLHWNFFTDNRYAPLLLIGAYYLVSSLVLRLVLFSAFGLTADASLLSLPAVLAVGVLYNVIELCYVLTPCSLYLLLMPNTMHRSPAGRVLLGSLLWCSVFAMLYLAVVQFYFFQEFSSRFNLVAVDYLIYPHEVFINIFQSYPVVVVLITVAALASIALKMHWRFIKQTTLDASPFSRRARFFLGHIAALALCAALFSTHSFDFSENRVVNEITIDGLSSFFEAFRTNDLNYKNYYRTGDSQQLEKILAAQLANDPSRSNPDPSDLTRVAAGSHKGLGKLNVVVIVEESFGCEQVDTCGQGLDIDHAIAAAKDTLTPHFDTLARQGVFFNKAYATGTRTVRGLEAITASFPPIPSESIIKRPGSEHIATWGKTMQENGYHTSFLYGGFSPFDNMKSFYAGNGFAISDRMDIKNPQFTNIWGVSDQDLFKHAQQYFDQRAAEKRPFFSIIMTTSNHSPYTFPAGIEGVQPKGGGRETGIRYADYALGEFFDSIKDKPWYSDTLFVVVADHGARVYGSEQFPMNSYEIPLLMLAPQHLPARQINTPISQMDIAPTVLGLLGLPYQAPFFGQDALAENSRSNILLFNHNHDVALYQNEQLVVLGLRNAVHTYSYHLGQSHVEETKANPRLTDLATAYYQTAFNLFTHQHY